MMAARNAAQRGKAKARRGSSELLTRSDIGGPTPWVIAVMTCLAMLGLAAALALGPAAGALSGQIAGRATIQIVEPDPLVRRDLVNAVRVQLRDAPYVQAVRVIPEAELTSMATQWLGDGVQETGLPLPALIDVDLIAGDDAGLQRLEQAMTPIAPAVRVIAHADWLGPVARLMSAIGWLAAGTALLLIAAAAAVAVLAARASLAAQRPTIDVLHLVGATDVQIARLFQRHTAHDSLWGALLGGLVAMGIVALIWFQGRGINSGLAAETGGFKYLALLLVPPLVVGVAMLTARLAVLRTLRHMP